MTSSKLDIWNLALGHAGQTNQVKTDTENSLAAIQCRRYYDQSRKAALEGAEWTFANTFLALTDLGTPIDNNWCYMYAYPNDCIKARRITIDGSGTTSSRQIANERDQIPFEIAVRESDNTKVILTNQEEAILQYTRDVELVKLFTESYIESLSLLLGSRLAMPLTRKMALRRDLLQEYTASLANAITVDLNEGQSRRDERPEILQARNGSRARRDNVRRPI